MKNHRLGECGEGFEAGTGSGGLRSQYPMPPHYPQTQLIYIDSGLASPSPFPSMFLEVVVLSVSKIETIGSVPQIQPHIPTVQSQFVAWKPRVGDS